MLPPNKFRPAGSKIIVLVFSFYFFYHRSGESNFEWVGAKPSLSSILIIITRHLKFPNVMFSHLKDFYTLIAEKLLKISFFPIVGLFLVHRRFFDALNSFTLFFFAWSSIFSSEKNSLRPFFPCYCTIEYLKIGFHPKSKVRTKQNRKVPTPLPRPFLLNV